MSSKWAVTDVVSDHYATFVDGNTGRPYLPDYAGMIGLPLALGVVLSVTGVTLSGVGELLSGVGVFTGGLFAMLLQLFGLAQRLADDTRLAGQRQLGRLIDELEANVSYSVLVGLVALGILMVAAATQGDDMSRAFSGATGAVLLHLVLTTFMALKRTREVYRRLRL